MCCTLLEEQSQGPTPKFTCLTELNSSFPLAEVGSERNREAAAAAIDLVI